MNQDAPIGIIELGNINIKCIIFKVNENNVSEILSTSIIPSNGIHNGIIVNLKKATQAIRLCISYAEKKSKVLLKKKGRSGGEIYSEELYNQNINKIYKMISKLLNVNS